jgi:hypothetical protein
MTQLTCASGRRSVGSALFGGWPAAARAHARSAACPARVGLGWPSIWPTNSCPLLPTAPNSAPAMRNHPAGCRVFPRGIPHWQCGGRRVRVPATSSVIARCGARVRCDRLSRRQFLSKVQNVLPMERPDGSALTRRCIQVLQQVVGSEFDVLVPPLRCSIHRRDQCRAMYSAEVAKDECVPGLGFLCCPVGETEVPCGVLLPAVRFEEGVLLIGPGLDRPPSRC